jgi:hypothetical protein
MGRKEEATAEFEKTKVLTKAADESLSSKLKKSPVQQVRPQATTPSAE